MTYRVSVTVLEKFRRYMAETTSYDTEQALIDCIRGVFTGTDQTKLGDAYHCMIEAPDKCTVLDYHLIVHGNKKRPPVLMPLNFCEAGLLFSRQSYGAIYEVPFKKLYKLRKYDVLASGRIDQTRATRLVDMKLKFGYMGAMEEYLDSLQWKIYLDGLGLHQFQYKIFDVQGFEGLIDRGDGVMKLNEGVTMNDVEPLKLSSYGGMRDDIEEQLSLFMDWIETNNLFHLLKAA